MSRRMSVLPGGIPAHARACGGRGGGPLSVCAGQKNFGFSRKRRAEPTIRTPQANTSERSTTSLAGWSFRSEGTPSLSEYLREGDQPMMSADEDIETLVAQSLR